MDNLPEGYTCGRSSDEAFLSVAGRAGGLVGGWLAGPLASPDMDSTSNLVRERGEGLAAGLWGPHASRCNALVPLGGVPGRTPAVASAVQRTGAYWCARFRLAVALIFGPLTGVIHQKNTLEGIVLRLARPLHCLVPGNAVAGLASLGRTVWRCSPL